MIQPTCMRGSSWETRRGAGKREIKGNLWLAAVFHAKLMPSSSRRTGGPNMLNPGAKTDLIISLIQPLCIQILFLPTTGRAISCRCSVENEGINFIQYTPSLVVSLKGTEFIPSFPTEHQQDKPRGVCLNRGGFAGVLRRISPRKWRPAPTCAAQEPPPTGPSGRR